MPKAKKPIEQYDHRDKERVNNAPVGLVTPETDRESGKKKYAYAPRLDPQLVWAGKAQHTSFTVPTVSLQVHERIDPRTIIKAVPRRNGQKPAEASFFNLLEENPPLREAIEFYKHKHDWSNRPIAGDSLLVMNSLIEKEGMAGQAQMIYVEPPYGIKYGSNLRPSSISAIRTHRDYLRNSMRSAEMARHLKEPKDKMMLSRDYDSFLESLKEAEETMLHENEDWRVVVRFH